MPHAEPPTSPTPAAGVVADVDVSEPPDELDPLDELLDPLDELLEDPVLLSVACPGELPQAASTMADAAMSDVTATTRILLINEPSLWVYTTVVPEAPIDLEPAKARRDAPPALSSGSHCKALLIFLGHSSDAFVTKA